MFEITGSDRNWHVVQGGRVLARADSFDQICMRHARLQRAARAKLRPCLCCATEFQSTGPQHRLCKACRADA